MTLDLAKVSPQLRQMGRDLVDRADGLRRRLEHARAIFADWAPRWQELCDLAEKRENRSRRLASPREPLDRAVSLPALPPNHRVIATDGSQIEPDRHGPYEYYLLNVGWAVLRYGERPDAELASEPMLAYELDDLFIMDEEQRRRVPVQGSHLAARRAVMELERAAALVEAKSDGLPLVALQDGTLLLWVLEERPEDFLREAFLRPYVIAMDRCRDLGPPLASYISRPRSTEVSSLLRAATCGADLASCGRCGEAGPTPQPSSRPGEGAASPSRSGRGVGGAGSLRCALDGLHDRMLFEHLQLGQRSAVFAVTLGQQLEHYSAGQRIHFFFLHVGSEVARVEVPDWVASDPAKLDLVHAVVFDQCQRGQGYPAALTRAHEQAIVRGADRNMLRVLLDSMFAQQGIRAAFSEKEAAKRLRAV